MSATPTLREDPRANAALLADFENRIARILADALLAELASDTLPRDATEE